MSNNNSNHSSETEFGCLGAILGGAMSWYFNHSILWGILHFFLGWLYVAYVVVAKGMPWWHLAPILQ